MWHEGTLQCEASVLGPGPDQKSSNPVFQFSADFPHFKKYRSNRRNKSLKSVDLCLGLEPVTAGEEYRRVL